jgi:hypothetical protein
MNRGQEVVYVIAFQVFWGLGFRVLFGPSLKTLGTVSRISAGLRWVTRLFAIIKFIRENERGAERVCEVTSSRGNTPWLLYIVQQRAKGYKK